MGLDLGPFVYMASTVPDSPSHALPYMLYLALVPLIVSRIGHPDHESGYRSSFILQDRISEPLCWMQGVPLIRAIKTAPRHCWMSLRQRAGVAQDSGWLDSSLEIIPLDQDSSVGFAVVVVRVSNVP